MDCAQAQQLLSEAVDREPVDASLLAEARAHCRTCADCARFVRGLALMQRAQAPAPEARLHDRVMQAIEMERVAAGGKESQAQTSAGVVGDTAEMPPLDDASTASQPTSQVEALEPPRRRTSPWTVGAWIGAAAALLIVAGFAAISGLRSIVSPTATSSKTGSLATEQAPSAGTSADSAREPGTTEGESQSSPEASAQGEATSPGYITVNGTVYRAVGTVSLQQSQLTTIGVTSTALDSGATPHSYTVFSTPTQGRVALVNGAGILTFDIVTRRLSGRPYVLMSEPITAYDVWPTLPAGFVRPTTDSGAPTFVPSETDDEGVQVFIQPGTPIESGFAVGPDTPPTDPAAGNPNWTWWATPSP